MHPEFKAFIAAFGGADPLVALAAVAGVKESFELFPKIGEGWQCFPQVAMR
jgi:hypothetical protein